MNTLDLDLWLLLISFCLLGSGYDTPDSFGCVKKSIPAYGNDMLDCYWWMS